MEETKVRSIDVDAALVERLERIADEQQRSLEAVLDEALEAYLAQEAEWDREAVEASEEYQRTGLHLTNDEVMDWLHRRANGEDVELPQCHT
jgi:predicted transcriptional regulator